MIGLISATIFWSFYDFRKFLKKIQSFQSLGHGNEKLPLAYSALLCFKEYKCFMNYSSNI